MNEQTPINESEPLSRRDARRQRREQRLADPSRGGMWIMGVILILLGIAFLLQTMGLLTISLKNWWALFILIPAIGSLDTAWRMYRNADNHWTAPARSSLLVGLVLLAVTAGFLLGVSWTYFGPILLILAGVGILFNLALGNGE